MERSLFAHQALHKVTGETLRPGGMDLTKRAVALSLLPGAAMVLDVGCGRGTTLDYLEHEQGLRVYGIEPDASLRRSHVNAIPGRAQQIPFRNATFDAVFCECVLSLVEDRSAALAECNRVLRTPGVVIVTDLYVRTPGRPLRAGDLPVRSCVAGARPRSSIERELEMSGFSIGHWEDHSRLLAELSARIIFEHGSLEAFWDEVGGAGKIIDGKVRDASLGYYLCIAQKD